MNDFFKFKQFVIHQNNCAMKVCTDASLFGAWVANMFANKKLATPNKILDIGAGTGLLSLMLAQKITVPIDAIEIDTQAFLQATYNVQGATFYNEVKLFNSDILSHKSTEQYDFIITNPPFYQQHLKATNLQQNMAMHDTTLSLEKLCLAIKNNLSAKGMVAILLPYQSMQAAEILFKVNQLYIQQLVQVKHAQAKNILRAMYLLAYSPCQVYTTTTILIKNEANQYSNEFSYLLKDYYLYL